MALNGLNTALSGLNVAQQQLDVIANNIANASTPGYSRKILPQSAQIAGGQTIGVASGTLMRQVDINLSRDFWSQVSEVNFYDVQTGYLDRIQQFHGAPDQEVSISAEMAELRDDFAALSDSPSDTFLIRAVIDQAEVVSNKINSFEDLLTKLRNDTQDDIRATVNNINSKLEEIAKLNADIKFGLGSGRSVADLQDARDNAVSELSGDIDVNFFTRGDGVMVIQTNNGRTLAEGTAEELHFTPTRLGPESYYPESAGAITVGDPTNQNATDITMSSIGGKLGGLIELRDQSIPENQAMLDETAYQLARRFDQQGLRLFTNSDNQIPGNSAPDPNADPPVAVEYVGFSATMQVNSLILDDNTLVRNGTADNDIPPQSGSNEVIRRIIEFGFTSISHQEATGNVDLRAGGGTLQDTIGIYSQSEILSTVNLSDYANVSDLIAAANGDLDAPNDQFELVITDPDMEAPPVNATPQTITIDLSVAAGLPGANAGEQLVNHITNELNAVPVVDPLWDASVSINTSGQLVIQARGNVEIDGAVANGMGDTGLAHLGLASGTYEAEDPYIDVQIGNDPVQRIYLEPLDDENDLFDKLDHDGTGSDTGVPGLAVSDDLTDGAGNGFLMLRPGDDFDNPGFGGDLSITGGSFETAGGVGIVEALFGNSLPVQNVAYQSETTAGSGNFVSFRTDNLGPGANINTGIISSSNLIDYSQKMINRQSEAINTTTTRANDERAFKDILQQTLLSSSGVNIEEELANLIRVQTAFSAAARVVASIDESFREFLNAVA